MSNLFEIAANATLYVPPPAPNPAVPAVRPSPKLKPLVQLSTLHSLQLARRTTTPLALTAEGLLAQFKADQNVESDSESSANDTRKRSYTREQKLAAISYAAIKNVWDNKR